jgi:hypothetical protein
MSMGPITAGSAVKTESHRGVAIGNRGCAFGKFSGTGAHAHAFRMADNDPVAVNAKIGKRIFFAIFFMIIFPLNYINS